MFKKCLVVCLAYKTVFYLLNTVHNLSLLTAVRFSQLPCFHSSAYTPSFFRGLFSTDFVMHSRQLMCRAINVVQNRSSVLFPLGPDSKLIFATWWRAEVNFKYVAITNSKIFFCMGKIPRKKCSLSPFIVPITTGTYCYRDAFGLFQCWISLFLLYNFRHYKMSDKKIKFTL